jgi:hypothetical protein
MKRSAWRVVVVLVSSACSTVRTAPAPSPADDGPALLGGAPYIYSDVGFAGGSYKHDTHGDSGVSTGHTDGGYARLRGEFVGDSAMGAGISIEGARSDDDLFENRSVETLGHTGDVFLYSLYYFTGIPPSNDAFRLPLRVGPYYHDVAIENDVSPTRVRWTGIGLRLEVEPEYWLVQDPHFAFGLYGGLSGGAHFTDADLRGGGSRTTLSGNGYTVGAGLGVEALFGGRVSTRIGYLYRDSIEGATDASHGLTVKGASVVFSGAELSIGIRF